MKNSFCIGGLILSLIAVSALAEGGRVRLVPSLKPSQTVDYLIRYQSSKNVKTESAFAAPMVPNSGQTDTRSLLQIEILDAQAVGATPALRARARFLPWDSGALPQQNTAKKADAEKPPSEPAAKAIEFSISAEGFVEKVQGLEAFSSEQQQAWEECVARFALAWSFPKDGVKPGEKWRSEQMENASIPIAGLNWERESTYVENQPCRPANLPGKNEPPDSVAPEDTCAVVLTTATLKQNSSSKDATPEDFKLRDLHTSGTAKGRNEIITYISLQTGLLVRATEEASQSMDVVVALADGSNSVHYNVNATSHSEVLLVTDSTLAHP